MIVTRLVPRSVFCHPARVNVEVRYVFDVMGNGSQAAANVAVAAAEAVDKLR